MCAQTLLLLLHTMAAAAWGDLAVPGKSGQRTCAASSASPVAPATVRGVGDGAGAWRLHEADCDHARQTRRSSALARCRMARSHHPSFAQVDWSQQEKDLHIPRRFTLHI